MTKEEVKNLPIGAKVKVRFVLVRDKSDPYLKWVPRLPMNNIGYFVGTATLCDGDLSNKFMFFEAGNKRYQKPAYGKYAFKPINYFQAARIKFGKRSKDHFGLFEDMEILNNIITLDLSKLCKEEVDEIVAYYKGFQK